MADEACAAPRAFISPGIAIDASRPINATTNNMSMSVKPASPRRDDSERFICAPAWECAKSTGVWTIFGTAANFRPPQIVGSSEARIGPVLDEERKSLKLRRLQLPVDV